MSDPLPNLNNTQIQCWCGAVGTPDELFDKAVFAEQCGGGGFLHCLCGGDTCVCHNHGEVECPGCPDCDGESDDDGEWDWEDELE